MKFKITAILLIAIIASVFLYFQTPQSKFPTYWEVWNDQEFRGYIIPSIHASRYSYQNHILELIENVDSVALEVDLRERYNYTKESQDVASNLSRNATLFFKSFFGNWKWEDLKNKKSGIVFSAVLNKLAEDHGLVHKMDMDSMKIALEKKKSLMGLEKLEDQIKFISGDSYQEEWLNRLEWLSENYFWLVTELDLIDIFYKKGDPEGFKELYKAVGENSNVVKDELALRDPILQKRSVELLKENKTLIMVGAAHVQGILDFLKNSFILKEVRNN